MVEASICNAFSHFTHPPLCPRLPYKQTLLVFVYINTPIFELRKGCYGNVMYTLYSVSATIILTPINGMDLPHHIYCTTSLFDYTNIIA